MKTDSERGEWGAWAFATRARFTELSAEQVAADIGYDVGTIRKVEAGSAGQRPPTRPLRRKLPAYYSKLALERSVSIDPPPGDTGVSAPTSPDMAVAIIELAAAVREQTKAIVARQDAQDEWIREVVTALAESQAIPASEPKRGAPGIVGR